MRNRNPSDPDFLPHADSPSRFILSQLATAPGVICVSLIVLQQIVVASSTLFLSRLIRVVDQEHEFAPVLVAYLASLLLPYLPGSAALFSLVRWKSALLRRSIDRYVTLTFGKTSFWQDRGSAATKATAFSSELKSACDSIVEYLYDLTSSTLNVAFNILAVGYVLGSELLAAYAVSVLISAVILKSQWRLQSELSGRWLRSAIELRNSLLGMPDHVFLGNRLHFTQWRALVSGQVRDIKTRHQASEALAQAVSLGVSWGTAAPCLGLVAFRMLQPGTAVEDLAVYVVTLPRLFMILGYTHSFLTTCSQWAAHSGRLRELWRILEEGTGRLGAFSPEKIRINGHPISAHDPGRAKSGRYTITGDNGTGKTTYLLLLKERLGERAIYLPPQFALPHGEASPGLSTGQAQVQRLLQVLRDCHESVLLLDEWDANLDRTHQERMSEQINQWIARNGGVVYEVRHRQVAFAALC